MNDFTEARQNPGLFSSANRQVRAVRRVWSSMLDLLYPPRCGVCNRIDTHLCLRCASILAFYEAPIAQIAQGNLTAVCATARHEGAVRDAVLAMKQDNHETLVSALGERLALSFRHLDWPITCVVPVPLHSNRLRERGYNQSALLATYLGQRINKPDFPNAISRTRNTGHQVGLSGDARRINVQNAFQVTTTLLADHAVLLIDDVYTTGATLQSCAEAVLKAGAAQAFGLTVTAADS